MEQNLEENVDRKGQKGLVLGLEKEVILLWFFLDGGGV